MFDDDTGAEPKIVSASFADPFLLLVRDDASIFVAQCDDSNELEEIEREDDGLLTTKWLTGCLYTDTTNAFANVQSDKGIKHGENVMMFLLSAGGALHVRLTSSFKSVSDLTCLDICSSRPFQTRIRCRGPLLRTTSLVCRLCC